MYPVSMIHFGARGTLEVGDKSYEIFRINTVKGTDRLPYSLKVLAENLLRTEDGANITTEHIEGSRQLGPQCRSEHRNPVHARTRPHAGLHRRAVRRRPRHHARGRGRPRRRPERINPLSPAEMVIDHSVILDVFGRADAFEKNVELEYERNSERYQFLRWGQGAFDDFKGRPAGYRHRPPGQPRVPRPRRR